LKTSKYAILLNSMEITIHTMHGTFIVPGHKLMELVAWLRANAIQANSQQSVQELQSKSNGNRQLINE